MVTQEQLDNFAKVIISDFETWSKNCNESYGICDCVIEFSKGKKYIKVIMVDSVTRRVHSFVDQDGYIWKAASWSTPAKNKPRGHIEKLSSNVVTWTGAV